MKSLTVAIVLIAAVFVSACIAGVQPARPPVDWIFCKGYSPGAMGGAKPGAYTFSSHAAVDNKIYALNRTIIPDTYPSTDGLTALRNIINREVDYYMNAGSINLDGNKININGEVFTEIVDKPCCDYGTRGGCINSTGKTAQKVKALFAELASA